MRVVVQEILEVEIVVDHKLGPTRLQLEFGGKIEVDGERRRRLPDFKRPKEKKKAEEEEEEGEDGVNRGSPEVDGWAVKVEWSRRKVEERTKEEEPPRDVTRPTENGISIKAETTAATKAIEDHSRNSEVAGITGEVAGTTGTRRNGGGDALPECGASYVHEHASKATWAPGK